MRIVSKAARYGIKVYVLTDAATAYVLRIIIYTGKATYSAETDSQSKMKTVQIVERLVEPFVGTFRTIYVDRFYTSLVFAEVDGGEKPLRNWNCSPEQNTGKHPNRKVIRGFQTNEAWGFESSKGEVCC